MTDSLRTGLTADCTGQLGKFRVMALPQDHRRDGPRLPPAPDCSPEHRVYFQSLFQMTVFCRTWEEGHTPGVVCLALSVPRRGEDTSTPFIPRGQGIIRQRQRAGAQGPFSAAPSGGLCENDTQWTANQILFPLKSGP